MEKKAKVPKLRFPGFAGDWEERKLGDIVEIIDGDRGNNYPKANDFFKNGHTLFLSAANITNKGFEFDDGQYITEEKSCSMGNGRVEENDIVLTSRGSLGNVAWCNSLIHRAFPFMRINSGMLILRLRNNGAPCFLEQFLRSPIGQEKNMFH